MKMNNIVFIGIFLLSVLISSISQLLLKKSAVERHGSVLHEYLNLRVVLAYTLFIGCTLLTIYAYQGVPLSLGPLLESTGYIYVAVFGLIFLREKISKKKLLGYILIIAGIVIFTL